MGDFQSLFLGFGRRLLPVCFNCRSPSPVDDFGSQDQSFTLVKDFGHRSLAFCRRGFPLGLVFAIKETRQ